jgi:hypothetical protein
LTLAGKVPDLVATDTRLSIGDRGKLGKSAFVLLGRIQLDQGAGAWNEWYASFSDGGFGWLAESMGRLLCTRQVNPPSALPGFSGLYAGQTLRLKGMPVFRVDEVGTATFVSAEGELPFRPELGASYRFADATSDQGGFLTLDYGTSGEEPELFAGQQLDYADAGLADRAPPPTAGRERARALSCPNCGGSLALKLADSKSTTCPSCRSLLDVEGDALRVIQVLAQRSSPDIPLGSKGSLRGELLEVLGFLRRYVSFEGIDFEWREYLLHGAGGYRFLSEYDGHWLFLRPVPGGKIRYYQSGASAVCDGRTFRHFQTGEARFREVQGEFYWRIHPSDVVVNEDYVAPPFLLSCEREGSEGPEEIGEINWSRGEYISGDEIWKSLSLPGQAPRARGIAPAQPNPYPARLKQGWRQVAFSVLALLALAGILFLGKSRTQVVSLSVPREQKMAFSEPFSVSGGRAMRLLASTNATSWAGLEAALIPDSGTPAAEISFELAPDEKGNLIGAGVFSALEGGTYRLRLEPKWLDEKAASSHYISAHLYRGAFLPGLFLAALGALLFPPLWLVYKASSFERKRWEESDHPTFIQRAVNAAATGASDDEE